MVLRNNALVVNIIALSPKIVVCVGSIKRIILSSLQLVPVTVVGIGVIAVKIILLELAGLRQNSLDIHFTRVEAFLNLADFS